jgi:hypothetical protein
VWLRDTVALCPRLIDHDAMNVVCCSVHGNAQQTTIKSAILTFTQSIEFVSRLTPDHSWLTTRHVSRASILPVVKDQEEFPILEVQINSITIDPWKALCRYVAVSGHVKSSDRGCGGPAEGIISRTMRLRRLQSLFSACPYPTDTPTTVRK